MKTFIQLSPGGLVCIQTLNVVVDQGQDIFPCKVLDCDSITQVKQKCLNQIYVNYPASQLTVEPEELHLGKCIN